MTHPLIGTQAPDFSLPNEVGDVVRLSDFLEQTVVLYFYPKAMTPGCTVQACGIRDSIDQFNARGLWFWVSAPTLILACKNSSINMICHSVY